MIMCVIQWLIQMCVMCVNIININTIQWKPTVMY